jgi:Flp pilus assembly protein TadG
VTTTVLVVPLVLVTMLFVVQFALAYYARTVVAGAAQDGASAAARRDASVADGIALAESLMEQGAGSLLTSHSATAGSDGEVVTVTAEAEVVSLLPFFGTITVSATGSAHVEEFTAQGADP